MFLEIAVAVLCLRQTDPSVVAIL